MTSVEIALWNGDWGLPTIEHNCLQVLSLIKFSGARAEIRYTNNPFNTPDGYLPSMKSLKKHLRNFEDIRTLLISKNLCPDLNLSPKQLSESYAFRRMIEEKLYPALRYTWWVDQRNYENVTRPWYAKALPFPLNFYYPKHYKQENENALHGLYENMELPAIELEIYREAEKCLTCLSGRLGDQDFFYGTSPSSLDAIVYGYLAPLMKAPLLSNVLQNHAKASANLVGFVSRISQRYFPRDVQDYEKKKQKEAKSKESGNSSDLLPHRRRNQILASILAVAASVTYGLYHGIFTISVNNVKEVEEVAYEIDESSN